MRLAVVLVAMLAGCATTDRLLEEGARVSYQSKNPVAQVAACVARNAERNDPGVFATERAMPDGPGREVLVRWQSTLTVNTMYAIHITERDQGSEATVIQFSMALGGKGRADKLMAGC